MIPPIGRDEALPILEPYLDPLGRCFWRAWDRWKNETRLPIAVAKRSRASLVYDYAAEEAWTTLPAIDGLAVTDDKGFVLVNVEDRLLVRFKKFRKGLRTSGIRTQQQIQFAYQQLTLDGLPAMPKLVVGYLLNDFELDIARVAITCLDGRRVRWAIDIPGDDGGAVAKIDRPTQPTTGPVVRSTRRQEGREESGEAGS